MINDMVAFFSLLFTQDKKQMEELRELLLKRDNIKETSHKSSKIQPRIQKQKQINNEKNLITENKKSKKESKVKINLKEKIKKQVQLSRGSEQNKKVNKKQKSSYEQGSLENLIGELNQIANNKQQENIYDNDDFTMPKVRDTIATLKKKKELIKLQQMMNKEEKKLQQENIIDIQNEIKSQNKKINSDETKNLQEKFQNSYSEETPDKIVSWIKFEKNKNTIINYVLKWQKRKDGIKPKPTLHNLQELRTMCPQIVIDFFAKVFQDFVELNISPISYSSVIDLQKQAESAIVLPQKNSKKIQIELENSEEKFQNKKSSKKELQNIEEAKIQTLLNRKTQENNKHLRSNQKILENLLNQKEKVKQSNNQLANNKNHNFREDSDSNNNSHYESLYSYIADNLKELHEHNEQFKHSQFVSQQEQQKKNLQKKNQIQLTQCFFFFINTSKYRRIINIIKE